MILDRFPRPAARPRRAAAADHRDGLSVAEVACGPGRVGAASHGPASDLPCPRPSGSPRARGLKRCPRRRIFSAVRPRGSARPLSARGPVDRRHARSPDRRRVRAHPDLPLRIWSEQRPSPRRSRPYYERARRLAAGLRARGIGPGDVVAFQLPNWIEAAATFFGLATLGAVLVPIVHCTARGRLGFVLAKSRARALVTADRFRRLDYLAQLWPRCGRRCRISSWRSCSRPRERALPAGDRRLRCVAARRDPLAGAARRRPGRAGGDRLHLGHDRRSQGRDPHAPQPRSPRSASSRRSSSPGIAPTSSARRSRTRSACSAGCCCPSTAASPCT